MTRLAIDTKLDYEHLAQEKRLRFKIYDKEMDKNLEVWGHEGLLRQVFINLIDNAIRYSFPNTLIIIRGKKGVGKNYLQVSNHGIRVPREDRERIFYQGVRLNKAKALIPDGTGLGLWLIRKIVETHGAQIRCTEIYESGGDRTAFQIFFPSAPLHQSVDRWRALS